MEYYKKSNKATQEIESHFHGVYEIYYFVSGNVNYMVSGKIYPLTPHSLILLPPNVMHGVQVMDNSDYVRYSAYFSPNDLSPERRSFLLNAFSDYHKTEWHELYFQNVESYHLEQFFQYLMDTEIKPESMYKILHSVFIESLLAQVNILCDTIGSSSDHFPISPRISEILNYLDTHLTDPLTLDSIAAHLFLSKNYVNHLFKQHTGTTIINYLNYKRAVLARQYIQAGESALNAALQSGFSDYSTFYRTYKKIYGTTPRSTLSTEKLYHPIK